jgi:hypothetical membrane protein
VRSLAVSLAFAGLLILLIAVLAAGWVTPGYDHARQYISELGASGAYTGTAVSVAFVVSGLLQAAFWLMAIRLLKTPPLASLGLMLSALNALGLFAEGVFPCDARCSLTGASPSAILHDILGGLGYLCGAAGILLAAIAWREDPSRRSLFRLALICGLPATVLVWTIHPGFELFGATQRALELAFAAWTIGVALAVRHSSKT